MKTSEVLHLAADLIEERGWSIGTGWRGTAERGALCVEGAIQAAMGVSEGPGYTCPAYHAVASYLGITHAMFSWNDKLPFGPDSRWVGGTKSAGFEHGKRRVIETLRAAALLEAAREDAALLAEVGAP